LRTIVVRFDAIVIDDSDDDDDAADLGTLECKCYTEEFTAEVVRAASSVLPSGPPSAAGSQPMTRAVVAAAGAAASGGAAAQTQCRAGGKYGLLTPSIANTQDAATGIASGLKHYFLKASEPPNGQWRFHVNEFSRGNLGLSF